MNKGFLSNFVIPSLEGRIFTGIVGFIAIMVLLGWVAINEPARMAAFVDEQMGRSIERGAELFAANCSTCHGPHGLGIAARAPGLNNPQLFGHDYMADLNVEISAYERQIDDMQATIDELTDDTTGERQALFAEIATLDRNTDEGAARAVEIAQRIEEINALTDTNYTDLEVQYRDLISQLENADLTEDERGDIEDQISAVLLQNLPLHITALQEQLDPLYTQRAEQLAALEPAFIAGYLPGVASALAADDQRLVSQIVRDNTARLTQYSFGGALEDYVQTTLIHGRPGSQFVWNNNQMVAWSQRAGGPLSDDKIMDIVHYILNWDKGDGWTLDDLYAVQQFGKIPADSALVANAEPVENLAGEPYNADVTAVTEALADVTGDAGRGEQLYTGAAFTSTGARLGCSGCHLGGAAAPDTATQWANIHSQRLNEPQFAGYTAEEYIVDSILYPDDYIVDGWNGGAMPTNFAEQLTLQDIADIIAYVASYGE